MSRLGAAQTAVVMVILAMPAGLAMVGCDDAAAGAGSGADVAAAVDAGGPDLSGAPDAATAQDLVGPPDVAPGGPVDAGPVDEPLPPVEGVAALVDRDPRPGHVEVDLTAAPLETEIDGVQLTMYAYDGQLPGPLLQARVGDEVVVHFTNQLPEPTTIHWHGVRVPDSMDGSPRIQDPVPAGGTFTYRFVVEDAGSFWYHPHVRANEQVDKGLYGPIVVHEAEDARVDADRFLVLDDLYLTSQGLPGFLTNGMEAMHGRTGNVLLVNGKAEALALAVSRGQVERWRVVNTANARTMSLSVAGARWRVVGADGGLLPAPYETDRLVVAVGQRYDLEVTFDGDADTATLSSHVLALDEQDQVVEIALPLVDVAVGAAAGEPTTAAWPAAVPLPSAREVTEEAWIELDATNDPVTGALLWTMNDQVMPEEPLFYFALGATVDLRLYNRAGPEHPFHLHGQFFEIVRRNGQPVTDEPGLKDTVLVAGMESVQIKAYLDNPGRWMAHCHILEHAELGMMAEIVVVP
jgi:FtsP/CotA-like multicopper oxidase with cupredoxin domain